MIKRLISSNFKKPAGLIGRLTSKLMVKGNKVNYAVLLKDLSIQPADKILEIGYGPGIGIAMIAEACNSCEIYGIDFSKLMYKKAQALNRKYINEGKVKLFYGDFVATNIDADGFDKIFCINVVYFWNNLETPFKKVRSFLEENGRFHFYMAHPDFIKKLNPADDIFNKYSIEQITAALSNAGFNNIQHYFNKGYYISAVK